MRTSVVIMSHRTVIVTARRRGLKRGCHGVIVYETIGCAETACSMAFIAVSMSGLLSRNDRLPSEGTRRGERGSSSLSAVCDADETVAGCSVATVDVHLVAVGCTLYSCARVPAVFEFWADKTRITGIVVVCICS